MAWGATIHQKRQSASSKCTNEKGEHGFCAKFAHLLIDRIDMMAFQGKSEDCCGSKLDIYNMHWPWGAGMFATSLGPDDSCFVAGANWVKGSGHTVTWASVAAVQKEIIEATITDEAAYGLVGRLIWHFVHHTPVHLFGGGPVWGYTW